MEHSNSIMNAVLIFLVILLGVAKLFSEWIRQRVPKSFVSTGFLLSLVVVVIAALLNGADVIPGTLDETILTAVTRASNHKGIPITEHQESLLRPLLESMEISLKRDPTADLPKTESS